jgi:peptidoglycan/xylan/chitin deacetylase (PgdA/CDA1 family)
MKKRISIIAIIGIAAAIAASGFFYINNAYVVPVLMYHSIDNNDRATKLSVSPESFARQMKFLHDNHYNIVGLEKIAAYIQRKEKVPPKTLAITLDDGYMNNYEEAYPVLKKYRLPATMFVIVDKVDHPGWLGWKELKEMSDSGVITVGSHTMSHRWLPSIDDHMLKYELEESKKVLEERLGRPVDFLCYPLGAYDERVEKAARGAGYLCALTTDPGRFNSNYDIYAIKRVRISRTSDNLFVFWIKACGWYTWVKEHRDD